MKTSMTLHQINAISITDVLSRLGIKYDISGNEIGLYDGGEKTGGRKGNVSRNFVNDFSKDRATGSPFSFVKKYLNISSRETFKWFTTHFR